MLFPGFRKTNNRAIAGFLMPFLAAGLACILVLNAQEDFSSLEFWLPLITLIPLLLFAGLFFSIRSISFIETLGDKDYAYFGIFMNSFFIILYIISVIYALLLPD